MCVCVFVFGSAVVLGRLVVCSIESFPSASMNNHRKEEREEREENGKNAFRNRRNVGAGDSPFR